MAKYLNWKSFPARSKLETEYFINVVLSFLEVEVASYDLEVLDEPARRDQACMMSCMLGDIVS